MRAYPVRRTSSSCGRLLEGRFARGREGVLLKREAKHEQAISGREALRVSGERVAVQRARAGHADCQCDCAGCTGNGAGDYPRGASRAGGTGSD